jgi:hypothetical protein
LSDKVLIDVGQDDVRGKEEDDADCDILDDADRLVAFSHNHANTGVYQHDKRAGADDAKRITIRGRYEFSGAHDSSIHPKAIWYNRFIPMNRNTIIMSMIILVAIGGIVALTLKNDTSTPKLTATVTSTPTPSPIAPRVPVNHVISATAAGVTPKNSTITAGDIVVFTNDTDIPFWPVSDTSRCAGLDARRSLARGDRYTLTLAVSAGTCEYHDARAPYDQSRMGVITVR